MPTEHEQNWSEAFASLWPFEPQDEMELEQDALCAGLPEEELIVPARGGCPFDRD